MNRIRLRLLHNTNDDDINYFILRATLIVCSLPYGCAADDERGMQNIQNPSQYTSFHLNVDSTQNETQTNNNNQSVSANRR